MVIFNSYVSLPEGTQNPVFLNMIFHQAQALGVPWASFISQTIGADQLAPWISRGTGQVESPESPSPSPKANSANWLVKHFGNTATPGEYLKI